MDITQLWTPLSPIPENKELIKQDLERGLAPNLHRQQILVCFGYGAVWKRKVQPHEVFEVLL